MARSECLSVRSVDRLSGSAGCGTWHPEAPSRFGATCTSGGGHGGAVQDPPPPLPAVGWERAVAFGQSSGRALPAPSPLPCVAVPFEPLLGIALALRQERGDISSLGFPRGRGVCVTAGRLQLSAVGWCLAAKDGQWQGGMDDACLGPLSILQLTEEGSDHRQPPREHAWACCQAPFLLLCR